MSKKNKLDQYYTKPDIALWCWDILQENLEDPESQIYVEPSAGCGNFLIDGYTWEAYDLDPKEENIVRKDFFEVKDLKGKVVVGNPPFGFASSLALRFINHCASYDAKIIAFILPRTFKKKLFQNKINTKLHLVEEVDLPSGSFLLEGKEYDVPCVFQIWKNTGVLRDPFRFYKYLTKGSKDSHDFIIRRVGGRAGKVLSDFEFTESSSLYVKGDVNFILKYQKEILQEASYTAGVKSITLDEINLIISMAEHKPYRV